MDERADSGVVRLRSVCVLLLFMDAGVGNGVEHAFQDHSWIVIGRSEP